MIRKPNLRTLARKHIFYILGFMISWTANANGQDRLYANEFPLQSVRLLDGPFKHAQDLNLKTLLEYDVDRLLAPYLKQAGLTPKKSSYKNWDGLDGHIGGHYLSALSMTYAATGNVECKKRLDYMIKELKACQLANAVNHPGWATGYVGGVPNSAEIWSTFKTGDFKAFSKAWVPWYNVHKMFAGLRDAWLYTVNEDAKKIFINFCNWSLDITAKLSDEQMQSMLGSEQGGMNEVIADAYEITGNKKYLNAAMRFSHHQLLEPMSRREDNLNNKHANTQVPKAIGFQRIGELSNTDVYKRAGLFFWETVSHNRTLALGGNSRREFFPSPASAPDFINDVEGPESCNTYNMLKLSEGLFRDQPLGKYMDFYEKALFNHILSAQHPVHGGYVYFTPARPRHYRVYSAPNKAMWCCVGSGMENYGKLGQVIYTHSKDSLFLNLFIASQLDWQKKGIKIVQKTNFPDAEKTRIEIENGDADFTFMVRYPAWVKPGQLKICVNDKEVKSDADASSYVGIKRRWKKGDVVEIELPMHTSLEQLPNLPIYSAILHGPILLAAKTGTQDLKGLVADQSRWGHIASGEKLPVDQAPILIASGAGQVISSVVPEKDRAMQFNFANLKIINPAKLALEPFYKIHDSRYMMYWMTLNEDQYKNYLDSLQALEKGKLLLEKRTVDFVAPGEQQPEVDHQLLQTGSQTGTFSDQFWRSANNGGYFSYLLETTGETELKISLKYWGAEWGKKVFDIYIDDKKLLTLDNSEKWNTSEFKTEEYAIPRELLSGKKNIRLRIQTSQGNTSSAIYYIRLLKSVDNK
ncbi:beta-L-arabinofuranosidase domain-containing protein [Pedobacter sp. P26]|uniref:glycoside hydrolase family 127 protein n=1 Tax=Pedobacter sp. P26 TaxID=3423956 RepID=UPI003D67CFBB